MSILPIYIDEPSPLFMSPEQRNAKAYSLNSRRDNCLAQLALGLDMFDQAKKLAQNSDFKKRFEGDESALRPIREICDKQAAAIYQKRKAKGLLFTWGRQQTKPPAGSTSGNESKASNSDCFVATAVYGSCDHPQVCVLRAFRDDTLMLHAAGRVFVRFYYRVGPWLAITIGRRQFAIRFVRKFLDFAVYRIGRSNDI